MDKELETIVRSNPVMCKHVDALIKKQSTPVTLWDGGLATALLATTWQTKSLESSFGA